MSKSGPNFKHALKAVLSTNHGLTYPNRYVPAHGLDVNFSGELAGPPGDVGLVKSEVREARRAKQVEKEDVFVTLETAT